MSRPAKATLAIAAALVALLAIFRVIDAPHHATSAAPATARGYLGVAEPGEVTSYRKINQFAASAGRKPDIVLYYSTLPEAFQAQFAARVHAHGAIPFVQISPGQASLAAVAAGTYDRYLRTYADQVRAFRHPVIIGFAPEMNGNWDSWGWGHTSPDVWVAAWRHVVTVFRQQSADNVTWLWTINVSARGTGPIHAWWPGASYVSWVGIDGYYTQQWQTFRNAFAPTIAAVRKFTNRPVLLSEVAIGQVAGKVAKLPDLFAGIGRNHLLGFVWFDETQHQGIYHQDWRLEHDPAALALFRRKLKNYYKDYRGLPADQALASNGPAG